MAVCVGRVVVGSVLRCNLHAPEWKHSFSRFFLVVFTPQKRNAGVCNHSSQRGLDIE